MVHICFGCPFVFVQGKEGGDRRGEENRQERQCTPTVKTGASFRVTVSRGSLHMCLRVATCSGREEPEAGGQERESIR